MKTLAPNVKANLEATAKRNLDAVLHGHTDCPVMVWHEKFSEVGLSPKVLGRLLAGRLTAREKKQAAIEKETESPPSPWSDKDY